MGKYQFVITSGPENPVRATRAMMFASRAVEEGHEVSIFLVDDAVYLANMTLAENIRAATGDTLMQYLGVIMAAKVPVNVCLPCVKARNLDHETFPDSWKLEKGVEAIRMSEMGFSTWTF